MVKELLAYQEKDKELRAIELELSGSEERKKTSSAKKYLEGVEESVTKLDNKANELMATFEALIAEKNKIAEQQAEINKGLEMAEDETGTGFLLKKADELIARIKRIETEANKILPEIQSVLKEYANIRNTTKAAQAQYTEYREKYNALKESRREATEAIKAELEKLKEKVDPALMEKYLEKRNAKEKRIFPVLYEVKGDVCGACNMQLSMGEIDKLKNGQIIECYQCRRLLYKDSEK